MRFSWYITIYFNDTTRTVRASRTFVQKANGVKRKDVINKGVNLMVGRGVECHRGRRYKGGFPPLLGPLFTGDIVSLVITVP